MLPVTVKDYGPLLPREVEPGKSTRKAGVVAWQGALAWLVSQGVVWAGVEMDAGTQAAVVAGLTAFLHGAFKKVKARWEISVFGVEVL